MKKFCLIFFGLFLVGCTTEKITLPYQNYYTYSEVKKILISSDISSDKTILLDDEIKRISFNINILNNDNNKLNNELFKPQLFVNGVMINDTTFTFEKEGTYSIYAIFDTFKSNTLNFNVVELSKHIKKIIISSNYGNEFLANGIDEAPVNIQIETDNLNLTIDDFKKLKLKINNSNLNSNLYFSTNQEGKYLLQIQGYGLESNIIEVIAKNRNETITYRVPVVFHMINAEFSDAQLDLIFKSLNNFFNEESFTWANQVYYYLYQNKDINHKTAKFYFYPSELDEKGLRLNKKGQNLIKGNKFDYSANEVEKSFLPWDKTRFLNIHFFFKNAEERVNGWAGIAGLGGGICYMSLSENPIERFDKNFGNLFVISYTPTLVHEICHLLSLPHTFENKCTSNPNIKDTYFYSLDELKIAIEQKRLQGIEIVTCENKIIEPSNIMDYFGSKNSLTVGQVDKIRSYYLSSVNLNPCLPNFKSKKLTDGNRKQQRIKIEKSIIIE